MDQVKIGKFISERRKAQGLTQMELAERLSVTDRAVSKWENGRSMPDSSIMLALCKELSISVNDLLCGEVVTVENYNEEMEKNLMEALRQKEQADKSLLFMEVLIGCVCVAILLLCTVFAGVLPLEEWQRSLLVLGGVVPLLAVTPFLLRIEQKAGYYECKECGHKYVPSFKAVLLASHIGRTRRMRCPCCNKKSWQKKVLSKDN